MGWRTVYFVGVLPLVLVMFARRNLRETRRFEQLQEAPSEDSPRRPGLTAIFRTAYKRRVFLLALVWTLTYMGTQNAVQFWKQFAITERGLTDAEVGGSIAIAAVASMPLVFLAGKLLDMMGRKAASVLIYAAVALGIAGAYGLHGRWPLTVGLSVAIFGVSAVLPVLNNYSAELFPTEYRADAFAWSNNLLGRAGYVIGPVLVGHLAGDYGWGPAVISTVIFPILGLVVVLKFFPETRGLASKTRHVPGNPENKSYLGLGSNARLS